MSIVALKKASLIGILEDKDKVLNAVQKLGCLHLIPLADPQKNLDAVPSGTGQNAVEALRWLLDSPAQRRPVTIEDEFNLDDIVHQVLANRKALKACEERRVKLEKRIREVSPWGQFDFPNLEEIGNYRLWFYIVPNRKVPSIDQSDKIIEVVHRDRYRSYVVLLSPNEPALDAMPVPRTHMGKNSLRLLEQKLEQTEVRLEGLELTRHALTKWRFLLARHLAEAKDRSARALASMETADAGRIFVLQAWAPTNHIGLIETACASLGIAVWFEEPAEDEAPPTLLDNPPPLKAGEDLVTFYQTPGYREWDPSVIVYLSFILFFGMIVADAGYGLFMLGGLFLFRHRLGSTSAAKRAFGLSIWLFLSSSIFGVLTGSYFGIRPSPESILGHAAIIRLSDIDTMMKATLLIGGAHVALANLMRSRHASSLSGRLEPIGWILILAGGFSVFLTTGAFANNFGVSLIAAGLLTVGLFSGNRKVVSFKTAGLRVFDGLTALARTVNIFSDVLSYMRLFALALAAASLAATVNDLANQVIANVPGIGLLIALAILAVGHAINVGLGLIAGTVHGLRLNVIEFFNWGMKNEGTPFRPFRKEETGL